MQVQLQAADAAKLGCDFVKEVIKISKAYRKSVNPKNCDVYEAFANYVKASTFTLYLSPNEVHCLKLKADSITSTTNDVTTVCADQVLINISSTTKVCKQTTTLLDPYPTVVLVNNNEHPTSSVTLVGTSDCSADVTNTVLAGGCTPTTCDEVYRGRIDIIKNYTLPVGLSYQDAVISSIRLYETDANGGIYTVHDVNLDPATSPYYGGVINPDDVKLGSPNFPVAFKTLLNRFIATRPGLTGTRHLIDPRVFGNTLQFLITAKHKPNRFIGIDKNDSKIFIKSPIYGITELTSSGDGYGIYPIHFYGATPTSSPCGVYNPLIAAQTSRINFNTAATNFNLIVLASSKALDPLTLTNSKRDCNIAELKATYSTIGELLTRRWSTSFNSTTYDSDTILADRTGTYYFTITLVGGCVVSKTFTVSSLPSNTISSDDEVDA